MSTRPYKATPFKPPRKINKSLARAASLSLARTMSSKRAAPTGELKFLDTSNSFTFDTTGEVPANGQLNLIPKGTGASERIGRKVHIKSIHMRSTIQPNAVTWSGGAMIRFLIVQDKQCNGAAATWSGVNGVLAADTISAFRNLDNIDRFVILKDWFLPITACAGVTTSFNTPIMEFEFHKKCNIPIEFDAVADTGAITTIRSNNLFMLARSTTDDDILQHSGVTRIRYIDG